MEIIRVTAGNIEKEHICCAISSNKDIQVVSKKKWLSERFEDGLVFLKGNVRGKCFIEYIPAENAWVPIEANGYMFINCLWVSGQYKGRGNSNLLLEECINDCRQKEKYGLCIISSKKKRAFLADSKYLSHKGFRLADSAKPYFELWYLPFSEEAPKPSFRPHAKTPEITCDGFVLYYSHQCPFTAKYVPLLKQEAEKMGFPFKTVLLNDKESAQNAPSAVTNFALFYNGRFITHEILSIGKFQKLVNDLQNEGKG